MVWVQIPKISLRLKAESMGLLIVRKRYWLVSFRRRRDRDLGSRRFLCVGRRLVQEFPEYYQRNASFRLSPICRAFVALLCRREFRGVSIRRRRCLAGVRSISDGAISLTNAHDLSEYCPSQWDADRLARPVMWFYRSLMDPLRPALDLV